jgi:hypothetical protein
MIGCFRLLSLVFLPKTEENISSGAIPDEHKKEF